ncbi:MAG TPA: M14 family zinc carboxypeptidase, partial [Pseudoxanthomonas sp.]|nr:M14 family zinc carboxypeptidase [Pseudoxanthomonas sp.]
PDRVAVRSFGTTPEGRPMQLLVVTATGAFDPAEARRRGLPVVLVQGGIHAGEIDGKDAGFLALRQVLEG